MAVKSALQIWLMASVSTGVNVHFKSPRFLVMSTLLAPQCAEPGVCQYDMQGRGKRFRGTFGRPRPF